MYTIQFHLPAFCRLASGVLLGLVLGSTLLAQTLPAQTPTSAEQQRTEREAGVRERLENNGYLRTTVSGRAVLPDGSPGTGFKIDGWSRSLTDRSRGFDYFDTVTNDNGQFTLDVYRPFAYWICIADPAGIYTAYDQHFELTEQPEGETIFFQLQKGIPVEGVVIDREKNEPVAGLPVYLNHNPIFISFREFKDQQGGWEGYYEWEKQTQYPKKTQTDAEGRFRFTCLPLNYLVSLNTLFGCFRTGSQEKLDLYTRLITVEESPTSVKLEIPTPWQGQILRQDGTPAAFYPVEIVHEGGFLDCVSDREGRFLLYDSSLKLESICIDTFFQGEWLFQEYNDEQLPKETVFQLINPITAKGRLIRESTGEPMTNFQFVCQTRHYHQEIITTDENGYFEIPKLFFHYESSLIYLNQPGAFNACAIFKKFKTFRPVETDPVFELGTIALEESGWLDPNALALLEKMPEIDGYTLDGKRLNREDFQDKIVFIEFWATWCGPCLQEIPRLKELYAKYHEKGFEIVGISLDEDLESLAAGIAKYEFPWLILSDEKLKQAGGQTMADRFAVGSIPRGILVRNGNVLTIDIRGDDLEKELRQYYGE